MKAKVRFDVRKPLKIAKIMANGGDWCKVQFKYEKLDIFRFVMICMRDT